MHTVSSIQTETHRHLGDMMGDKADNPVQDRGYADLEVEKTLSTDELDSLPSFDDGSGQAFVAIPTGASQLSLDDPAEPKPQTESPKTTGPDRSLPRPRQDPPRPEDPGEQPEGSDQAAAHAGIYGVLLRYLDLALTVVNCPFARIPAPARPGIGIAAIVTIGMSGLAVAAKIYLFPDKWMQVAAAREAPHAVSKPNDATSVEATGEQP